MSENKWDLKQVGSGAGATALALFLMQTQGIDLQSKSYQAQNQVVIEKTLANAQRIQSLEENVSNLTNKIDKGFDDIKDKMTDQVSQILTIVSDKMEDRYTKTEHNSYARNLEERVNRIIRDIDNLREELRELSRRKR